jgi:hypothetical protein
VSAWARGARVLGGRFDHKRPVPRGAGRHAARIGAQKERDMSGNRRRRLELVYSNDAPVRVVEPAAADSDSAPGDAVQDTQAIERFLTYLYDELRSLEKHQPAHLVGAAIVALREDVRAGDGGTHD